MFKKQKAKTKNKALSGPAPSLYIQKLSPLYPEHSLGADPLSLSLFRYA